MNGRGTLAAALAAMAAIFAVLALFGAEIPVLLRAWLVAAHFVLGLSLGASVLLLIHAITGGRWGLALGPSLLGLAGAMPLAVLAWLPLLIAAGALFPWVGIPREQLPELVAAKLAYLDLEMLRVRTIVALALFLAVAWMAGAWSHRPPAQGPAAGALMVFGIAITVFTTDWLLAFEPSFYSSVYPVLHGVGAVIAALAAATLWLRARGGDPDRLRDCGMLMLGWAMVWIYLGFMQYLIIWSGNLPHEIEWYLVRTDGSWRVALWLAVAAHVGVVAAMTSPVLKAWPNAVAAAAGALLLGQIADLWWRTAPAFERTGLMAGVLDLAAIVALGVLWLIVARIAGPGGEAREVPDG